MTAAARGATVAVVNPGDDDAADPPADGRIGLLGRLRLHPDPRRDTALTLAVAALVALSRWLAFPASIWDIDDITLEVGSPDLIFGDSFELGDSSAWHHTVP